MPTRIVDNIVDEACRYVIETYREINSVGILGTNGLVKHKVYHKKLIDLGTRVVEPRSAEQAAVHEMIYDKQWGLKARGYATKQSIEKAQELVKHLEDERAELIFLACTELSLIGNAATNRVAMVDTLSILAAALVRACAPQKLRNDWKELMAAGSL